MEANISLFTVYICYMLSLHLNNQQYTLNNINVCSKLELFAHRTKKVVHPFNKTHNFFVLFFVIPVQNLVHIIWNLQENVVEYKRILKTTGCIHTTWILNNSVKSQLKILCKNLFRISLCSHQKVPLISNIIYTSPFTRTRRTCTIWKRNDI